MNRVRATETMSLTHNRVLLAKDPKDKQLLTEAWQCLTLHTLLEDPFYCHGSEPQCKLLKQSLQLRPRDQTYAQNKVPGD